MNAKFKWGLAALALIASNEVLTWVILAVLFFSALAAFAKEAVNDV
jgi:hypothetical protein